MMNIKELANRIDNNTEDIRTLYKFCKVCDEGETKIETLAAEACFIFHALDLHQGHDPEKIKKQYEIIEQISALFVELNNLLIK